MELNIFGLLTKQKNWGRHLWHWETHKNKLINRENNRQMKQQKKITISCSPEIVQEKKLYFLVSGPLQVTASRNLNSYN